MIRSMTGFGTGVFEKEDIIVRSIIKTTNHKYLNLKLNGIENKELENKAEKVIKNNFSRGRIEVQVKVEGRGPGEVNFPSPEKVRESYNYLEDITSQFSIPQNPRLSDLIQFGAFRSSELEEDLWSHLKKSLLEAIERVKEDQRKEGERLRSGLEKNLEKIESLISEIESGIPSVVENYRERLLSKIEEFIGSDQSQERDQLGREVAIYADKVDVDEEVDRIRTHVENARSTIDSEGSSGKKLGFIAQELKREANTVSAKCKDGAIQEMAVEMKLEIEKFNEQVRNIE